MVWSPSAKDERRRRKSSPELERSSPELGKMTESTSDSRNPPHHDVELDEANSRVVSIFAPEVHGFAGKARRKFTGI
jgi:hypothetical protein